jgi:hypothetical protein
VTKAGSTRGYIITNFLLNLLPCWLSRPANKQ